MATGLIIADDDPFALSRMHSSLQQSDIEILAETNKPAAVVQHIRKRRPDVLLMDVVLAGKDTSEIVQEIKANHLPCRVLIFSREREGHAFLRLLKAGITGYIPKTEDPNALIQAVQAVSRGISYFSPEASSQLAAYLHRGESTGKDKLTLTRQERKILQQAFNGSTNGEIASSLSITERTVEFHMSNLLHKLGAKRRLEAVVKAKNLGLL